MGIINIVIRVYSVILSTHNFKPDNFNDQGFIPIPASDSPEYLQQTAEFQKDIADISAWEDEQAGNSIEDKMARIIQKESMANTSPSPLERVGERSPLPSDELQAAPADCSLPPAPRSTDSTLPADSALPPARAGERSKKSPLQTMEESFGKDWRNSDLTYYEMRGHVSEAEEERRRNILERAERTIRKVYPDYDPATGITGEPIIPDIDSPEQTNTEDAA